MKTIKKCSCVNATYEHIKPEERTHPGNKWKCLICKHQFKGT